MKRKPSFEELRAWVRDTAGLGLREVLLTLAVVLLLLGLAVWRFL